MRSLILLQQKEERNSAYYEKETSREKSHQEGKENINNPHPRETEYRIKQSLSKPTASVCKSFREKRYPEMETRGETDGKIVDEDEVKV